MEYYKGNIHPLPPPERVYSQAKYIDQTPQVTISKVVLSVLAFLALLVYLITGHVYMSETYCPKSKSLQVLLHSFTTSNFHVRSPQPLNTTVWEATLTIRNYHKDNLKILVQDLQSVLYYKDNAFSCAWVLKKPIKIGSFKERLVTLKFMNSTCVDKSAFSNELNDEIIRERRTWKVRLGMQMKMVVSSDIIESLFSSRFSILDVRYLDKLDVQFVHGIRMGRLVANDQTLRLNSTLSSHGY